jgi:peptidoglycan L-alanyl-D-glutamate endopeptidase CwlK
VSRRIEDLTPAVQQRAKALVIAAKDAGIDLLITSTYRSNEEQAALYAQGRTKPGAIVTNARPGDSYHNWRCAFDVVPLRNGKPVWGTSGPDGDLWRKIGEMGEAVGLEWAGRWGSKFREYPHFQYTGGLTIEQVKAGRQVV